jgi:hypothetical protein
VIDFKNRELQQLEQRAAACQQPSHRSEWQAYRAEPEAKEPEKRPTAITFYWNFCDALNCKRRNKNVLNSNLSKK